MTDKLIFLILPEQFGKLWVQDLDQEAPRELVQGLLQGGFHSHPFWSPDSRQIGFADGTTLKRIAVSGGQAAEICEIPVVNFAGGSWSQDGSTIVYVRWTPDPGQPLLYEVAVQGAEEILEIGRSSYQLRDDDNIHLARQKALVIDAVDEGRRWLGLGVNISESSPCLSSARRKKSGSLHWW